MAIALSSLLKPSTNRLFLFIPITWWLKHTEASAPIVFFTAALAISPIAQLIVNSTEKVAVHAGDAVGGLLNATFGNAPVLLISFLALKAGLCDLVPGSLLFDGPPLLITFGTGTIVTVLLTVLMSAVVTSDGKSQWFKGEQLLLVYLIIALMLYFVPEIR